MQSECGSFATLSMDNQAQALPSGGVAAAHSSLEMASSHRMSRVPAVLVLPSAAVPSEVLPEPVLEFVPEFVPESVVPVTSLSPHEAAEKARRSSV